MSKKKKHNGHIVVGWDGPPCPRCDRFVAATFVATITDEIAFWAPKPEPGQVIWGDSWPEAEEGFRGAYKARFH
jgi:hypothetical protein